MKNKKKLLGLGALIIIIAAFALIYGKFSEKPVEGSKAITIEVINSAEESTMYEVQTFKSKIGNCKKTNILNFINYCLSLLN